MSKAVAAGFAPEYAPIAEKIRAISPDRYDDAVFKHGLDFYRQRIGMMGATGFDRVLDAGQGFGQWSIVLAEKNGYVSGIDHGKAMCAVAEVLKEHYKAANFDITCDSLYNVESHYPARSFDLVWCWGVIMFTERQKVMAAFNRLLKPGGKLMLGGVNTPVRWAYKYGKGWKDRLNNPHFFAACVKGMRGSHNETGINAFGIGSARVIGERYGFALEGVGYDGRLDVTGNRTLPFEDIRPKQFHNIDIVYRKTSEFEAPK